MNSLYETTLADALIQNTRVSTTKVMYPVTRWAWIQASRYLCGPMLDGYDTGIYIERSTPSDILVLVHALTNSLNYDPDFRPRFNIQELALQYGMYTVIADGGTRSYIASRHTQHGPLFSFYAHKPEAPSMNLRCKFYTQILEQVIGPLFGSEGSGS